MMKKIYHLDVSSTTYLEKGVENLSHIGDQLHTDLVLNDTALFNNTGIAVFTVFSTGLQNTNTFDITTMEKK